MQLLYGIIYNGGVLCSAAIETAIHILVQCPFSKSIWLEIANLQSIQVGCVTSSSIWTRFQPLGRKPNKFRIDTAIIAWNI